MDRGLTRQIFPQLLSDIRKVAIAGTAKPPLIRRDPLRLNRDCLGDKPHQRVSSLMCFGLHARPRGRRGVTCHHYASIVEETPHKPPRGPRQHKRWACLLGRAAAYSGGMTI